jgi:ABC-type multidrug transport system permease subunit
MLAGLGAIIYKETIQVRRDPATKFVFLVPLVQLTIFGYAIDLDVRDVPTVVFNADRRAASREFVNRFESSGTFTVIDEVGDAAGVRDAIVSGRAQVGLVIPARFSDDLLHQRQPQVQVLIDGSNSNVAMQAMAAAAGIADAAGPRGTAGGPIDVRPRMLFNENIESANFFVPGLVGIILQLTTVLLTAFSIVRERERGTMEQLMVTPVSRWALMLGKVLPFAVIGTVVICLVLSLMVFVFRVPISGNIFLLLALSGLFLVPSLGLGILISTVAQNQAQATQLGLLVMLPSVLLTGFLFPREQMPLPIYALSFAIPATYYIEILRGVILRAAGFEHVWPQAVALGVFAVVILTISTLRFHKRLD